MSESYTTGDVKIISYCPFYSDLKIIANNTIFNVDKPRLASMTEFWRNSIYEKVETITLDACDEDVKFLLDAIYNNKIGKMTNSSYRLMLEWKFVEKTMFEKALIEFIGSNNADIDFIVLNTDMLVNFNVFSALADYYVAVSNVEPKCPILKHYLFAYMRNLHNTNNGREFRRRSMGNCFTTEVLKLRFVECMKQHEANKSEASKSEASSVETTKPFSLDKLFGQNIMPSSSLFEHLHYETTR